jgi:hypothetical protein
VTSVQGFINEIKSISDELLVVFTGPCLKTGSTQPCNVFTLGSDSLISGVLLAPFSHASIYNSKYSLARRISDMLNLKEQLISALDEVNARSTIFLWDDDTDGYKIAKTILPIARTYIYCSLCVCSIQTAIAICKEGSSTIHEYTIRPDERLKSSCQSVSDGTAGMRAVYDMVKEHEAQAKFPLDHTVPTGVMYIDMFWLEEKLYRAELKNTTADQVQPSKRVIERNIVIGELNHLQYITQGMSSHRVPKASEIWSIRYSPETCDGKLLGAFTASRLKPLSVPSEPVKAIPDSVMGELGSTQRSKTTSDVE